MPEEPITKADLTNAVLEIKGYVDDRTREIKEYVDERTHDAETRLLRSFADFHKALGIRMSKMEADVGNVNVSSTTRLGQLETKMTDIEIRLIRLESNNT